jgi:hypothetical protein
MDGGWHLVLAALETRFAADVLDLKTDQAKAFLLASRDGDSPIAVQ